MTAMVLDTKPRKPAAVHHKKRTGAHHKHTKHYTKAYWPYLPMLAVVGFGFVANMFWPLFSTALRSTKSHDVLAYATSMSSGGLLQLTNAQRTKAGETGLVINDKLTKAAQMKADDMAARGYWSHTTPDGREPWWFVTAAGYDYMASGENLAYGFDSSQGAVTGWMNSPGHRANILNAVYSDVGFGIANAAQYQGHGPETIVVALYGSPVPGSAPAAVTAPTPAPTAASTPSLKPAGNASPTPDIALAPSAASSSPQTFGPKQYTYNDTGNQRVARLETVAATASPLSVVFIVLIGATAAAIFILRHVYFWHRTLVRGEQFIIQHWKFDLVVVAIMVAGVLLTRTAGFIQ